MSTLHHASVLAYAIGLVLIPFVLHGAGHIENLELPRLYCPDCRVFYKATEGHNFYNVDPTRVFPISQYKVRCLLSPMYASHALTKGSVLVAVWNCGIF